MGTHRRCLAGFSWAIKNLLFYFGPYTQKISKFEESTWWTLCENHATLPLRPKVMHWVEPVESTLKKVTNSASDANYSKMHCQLWWVYPLLLLAAIPTMWRIKFNDLLPLFLNNCPIRQKKNNENSVNSHSLAHCSMLLNITRSKSVTREINFNTSVFGDLSGWGTLWGTRYISNEPPCPFP